MPGLFIGSSTACLNTYGSHSGFGPSSRVPSKMISIRSLLTDPNAPYVLSNRSVHKLNLMPASTSSLLRLGAGSKGSGAPAARPSGKRPGTCLHNHAGRVIRRSKLEFILCRLPPAAGPSKLSHTGADSHTIAITAATSRRRLKAVAIELNGNLASPAALVATAKVEDTPERTASSKHHSPGTMVNQLRKDKFPDKISEN
mmetsp:Transcript_4808/g.8296  ORF Transcript_4808/g.8296 Transcript_4808/m.8296 type:complete len:200 (-) Transcript_4808:1406-2005(-)